MRSLRQNFYKFIGEQPFAKASALLIATTINNSKYSEIKVSEVTNDSSEPIKPQPKVIQTDMFHDINGANPSQSNNNEINTDNDINDMIKKLIIRLDYRDVRQSEIIKLLFKVIGERNDLIIKNTDVISTLSEKIDMLGVVIKNIRREV